MGILDDCLDFGDFYKLTVQPLSIQLLRRPDSPTPILSLEKPPPTFLPPS